MYCKQRRNKIFLKKWVFTRETIGELKVNVNALFVVEVRLAALVQALHLNI